MESVLPCKEIISYVFRREGDSWIEETILRHNLGEGELADFGTSVAIKGDLLAVGAPQEAQGSAERAGIVYLYQRDGQQWNLVNKISADDQERSIAFGSVVALSENTLVVTAGSEINSDGKLGAVYVFSLADVISTSTDRPTSASPILDVQAYPSPFNSQLNVSYNVPQPGHVTIHAYDILGRKVASLEDAFKPAGTSQLTWSPEDEALPVGMYFLRIEAGGASQVVPVIRQ